MVLYKLSNLFQDSQSASLNLSKVAGIFYILIGGMVVAMVAALIEFLYRSRLEARKNNVRSLPQFTLPFTLIQLSFTRLFIPEHPEFVSPVSIQSDSSR